MLKKWFMSIGLLFCVFLFTSTLSWAAEPVKIGVIDARKCIEQTEEGKKIHATLKEKSDRIQKDLDARKNEIIKMREDLSKKSNLLGAEARRDKEKDLLRKEEDFRDLAREKEAEYRKEESSAFQKLFNELFEVTSKIAKDEGYTLILEAKTGVVYYNSAIDITDRVIKSFNEKNNEKKAKGK
jgi:outer membrane protein